MVQLFCLGTDKELLRSENPTRHGGRLGWRGHPAGRPAVAALCLLATGGREGRAIALRLKDQLGDLLGTLIGHLAGQQLGLGKVIAVPAQYKALSQTEKFVLSCGADPDRTGSDHLFQIICLETVSKNKLKKS